MPAEERTMSKRIRSEGRPREALLERLAGGGLVAERDLTVDVRGNVAHVGGSVSSVERKRRAHRIASEMEGVLQVVNTLRVAPVAVVGDDSIREHLLAALAENPGVDEMTIYVEIASCVVHLRGVAATEAGRCCAEDEAWATPGVRRVINAIQVGSVVPPREAALASEIAQAIRDRLGSKAARIRVEVRAGIVRLTGSVPSEHVRAAAERLAWTPLVTDVANDLTAIVNEGAVMAPVPEQPTDRAPAAGDVNVV